MIKLEVKGKSMLPLIKIGDQIEIEQVKDIKIGDIIVFNTKNFPIVHRVIGKYKIKGKKFFVHKGDNSFIPGITKEDSIIGKLTSINRDEKFIKLNNNWCKHHKILIFYYSIIIYLFSFFYNLIKIPAIKSINYKMWKMIIFITRLIKLK